MSEEYPWRDEDALRGLYHGEQLSQVEIADRWGAAPATICNWMERHEIEARSRSLATSIALGPLRVTTAPDGYEFIQTRQQYKTHRVRHHRLLAVAEYGFENVSEKVVHHRNGIPWDNRGANLELLSDSEHKRIHADGTVRDRWGDSHE